MTIPKITPYSGGVANPDGSQTQTEFTQNMFDQLSYEAELSTELNNTVDGINDTATQVNSDAANASQSAAVAEAAASGLNYQGLWPDTGGSAGKGETWQTQASGTPTGQYFTSLQNTTVDPVSDDVNWRALVSTSSLGKFSTYRAESIADMILGITASGAVPQAVGSYWNVGGEVYERTSLSNGDINDFRRANNGIESLLDADDVLFPENGSVSVGDVIPSGVTHLSVGGRVFQQVPTRSGTVNEIIEGQVLVGSVKCQLISNYQLNKATPAAVISKRLRDGTATNIACYGDSTMWGATVGDLLTQNPNNSPAMLNEALNQIYGGGIATVSNRGQSGTTIRQMISGGDGSGSTFAEKLIQGGLDADADVVYCNHGTNDSTGNNDITQYKLDLMTFISHVRLHDKTPILITPNPKTIGQFVDETKLKNLQHYVNAMREVASQYDVALVDQYELFSLSNNIFRPDEIAPDGVHLSNGAYRQAGYNLAIPLVNTATVTESIPVTLNKTSWTDNFSVGRAIQNNTTAIGGFAVKADRATDEGINIPFIFNEGSRVFDISGLKWSNGTVVDAYINKVNLLQKLDFEATAGSTSYINYDSRQTIWARFYAGLNVAGLIFDSSEVGANNQIAIGGVIKPTAEGASVTSITGTNLEPVRIGMYEQLVTTFNFVLGGDKLVLADLGGNDAVQIYITSGGDLTLDVVLNGGVVQTAVLSGGVNANTYPVNYYYDGSDISVNVGSLSSSLSRRGIPELYLKTPNLVFSVTRVLPA